MSTKRTLRSFYFKLTLTLDDLNLSSWMLFPWICSFLCQRYESSSCSANAIVLLFNICKSNRPNFGFNSLVFGYFGIDNIDVVRDRFFLVDIVYASCLTDGTVSGLKQAFVDICTHLKNIFSFKPRYRWHSLSNVEFISSNQAMCQ